MSKAQLKQKRTKFIISKDYSSKGALNQIANCDLELAGRAK